MREGSLRIRIGGADRAPARIDERARRVLRQGMTIAIQLPIATDRCRRPRGRHPSPPRRRRRGSALPATFEGSLGLVVVSASGGTRAIPRGRYELTAHVGGESAPGHRCRHDRSCATTGGSSRSGCRACRGWHGSGPGRPGPPAPRATPARTRSAGHLPAHAAARQGRDPDGVREAPCLSEGALVLPSRRMSQGEAAVSIRHTSGRLPTFTLLRQGVSEHPVAPAPGALPRPGRDEEARLGHRARQPVVDPGPDPPDGRVRRVHRRSSRAAARSRTIHCSSSPRSCPGSGTRRSITDATTAVVRQDKLIRQIAFPKLVLPMATTTAGVVGFAWGMVPLACLPDRCSCLPPAPAERRCSSGSR